MKNDSLTIDPSNYDMNYLDRSHRAMNPEHYRNQATTPQFAVDRISKIEGKSEQIGIESQDISVLKHYDESLKLN